MYGLKRSSLKCLLITVVFSTHVHIFFEALARRWNSVPLFLSVGWTERLGVQIIKYGKGQTVTLQWKNLTDCLAGVGRVTITSDSKVMLISLCQ